MKSLVDNVFRTLLAPLFFLCSAAGLQASDDHGGKPERYTRAEYIAAWKDVAIESMHKHGIPASITLAQAILESGDGNSELARKANNHFGIKCHDWTGARTYHDDDARGECFRKYKSAAQSFEDHSLFLKRSRYLFLYEYGTTDYKSWAKGLKKAGYATNPKYADLLIRLIEENDLHKYDKVKPGAIASTSKTRRAKDEGEAIVLEISRGLEVFRSDNRIKYVVADRSYPARDLAEQMNMGAWQIRKYNDLDKGDIIEKGERVYLQPKRNKSRTVEYHVVQEGETLRDISQRYGVKIKRILRRSNLPKDHVAQPGDTLRLR